MSDIEDATLADLAEDVLPAEVEADAVPIPLTTLFPWHRPRKQKVRRDQWVGLSDLLIKKLLNQALLSEPEKEIRYLTLPGVDYLDVRLIGAICREAGLKLTSTGFLSDAEKASVMARARVREAGLVQAGYISDRSTTFPRDLESICGANSGTLKELKRRAPFHVVNIDACGSIAPARAQHSARLIDAVYRLVELQLSRANHRWLLFLTVDVRDGDMDGETFQNLCNAIRDNCAENPEFNEATLQLLGPAATCVNECIDGARAAGGHKLLTLFSLGVAKWLLHLAKEKQWSVKLKPSHCYSTTPEGDWTPTMCSLAFEFLPPPAALPDRQGVTRQQPAGNGAHPDMSMQIIAAAAGISNLDHLLEQEGLLAEVLNLETHSLLAEAGYDAGALAPLVEPRIEGQPTPPHRFPDLVVRPSVTE